MSCEVTVLYFARSAELAGLRTETISVPQQITSLQLWREIVKRHSSLADIEDQVIFAICQEYVPLGDQQFILHTGDEVAIIPPLSGARQGSTCKLIIGSPFTSREIMSEIEDEPKDVIQLKFEKLSLDEVAALVISPCCGAASFFVGTTRNNFEGRKVIQLEYEAYTAMAEGEAKKICKDIRLKWPSVKHIAIHHRLGLVPISEASVIVAISSPHRAESLSALQYCINTLKATVPIWKKEVYEEDSSWKENKECFWIKGEK